jgi:hypothetical protein
MAQDIKLRLLRKVDEDFIANSELKSNNNRARIRYDPNLLITMANNQCMSISEIKKYAGMNCHKLEIEIQIYPIIWKLVHLLNMLSYSRTVLHTSMLVYNCNLYEIEADPIASTWASDRFIDIFQCRLTSFIKQLGDPKQIPHPIFMWCMVGKFLAVDPERVTLPNTAHVGNYTKRPITLWNAYDQIMDMYYIHLVLIDLMIEFSLSPESSQNKPLKRAKCSKLWEPRIVNLIFEFAKIRDDDISDLSEKELIALKWIQDISRTDKSYTVYCRDTSILNSDKCSPVAFANILKRFVK